MKPPIAYARHAEELPLEAALLVYGHRYVTKHDILRIPGRAPQLGAGSPLDRAQLAKLLAAAGRDAGLAGWVDPRVLYIGPDLVVWHSPARFRTMFFQCSRDKEAGRLRDFSGQAPQPGLVWAVRGNSWYVWAVIAFHRPTPETPLFQAPYLNVYDDGGICTGNAAVPRQVSTEVIDGFERAFFESRFTHPNAPNLTTHPDGIYALWTELVDNQATTFPNNWLTPLTLTLGDVVRRLTKESDDDLRY